MYYIYIYLYTSYHHPPIARTPRWCGLRPTSAAQRRPSCAWGRYDGMGWVDRSGIGVLFSPSDQLRQDGAGVWNNDCHENPWKRQSKNNRVTTLWAKWALSSTAPCEAEATRLKERQCPNHPGAYCFMFARCFFIQHHSTIFKIIPTDTQRET